jgi:hypothetical protein
MNFIGYYAAPTICIRTRLAVRLASPSAFICMQRNEHCQTVAAKFRATVDRLSFVLAAICRNDKPCPCNARNRFTSASTREAAQAWLKALSLAPKTKSHIRSLMHIIFQCANRWELTDTNPIELVRVKGGSKRRLTAQKELMRHASIQTTMNVYGKAMQRASVKQIAKLCEGY